VKASNLTSKKGSDVRDMIQAAVKFETGSMKGCHDFTSKKPTRKKAST
jgi:hypothetical protein